MASFSKRGNSWRAQVKVNGQVVTRTFDTKPEARAWADQESAKLRAVASNAAGGAAYAPMTLGELLERYGAEVSPHKASGREEVLRIKRLQADPVAALKLRDVTPAALGQWRDRRKAADVAVGTLLREWNLLRAAINHAVREWDLMPTSPTAKVKMPAAPDGRDKLLTADECERMLHTLGYSAGGECRTIGARVGAAFIFALETGMRCGEICALQWADVDTVARVAKVRGIAPGAGKTRAARRDVPLSAAACAVVEQLRPLQAAGATVFAVTAAQCDANFRNARARAALSPDDSILSLHFHDSRHAAITSLAGKLDVLALARMVGHRDLAMLQRYYNESAASIAQRL